MAKRVAASLRHENLTARKRLALCLQLLGAPNPDSRLAPLSASLQGQPTDELHYWVGTFYTLLLSREKRKQQSAYFTPPAISRNLLDILEKQGTDWTKVRVLDPAAGGAAFLSMVASRMLAAGSQPQDILRRIKGIEIDANLAELARILIARRLGLKSIPKRTITVANSLKCKPTSNYDLVLANPPYGRVSPSALTSDSWKKVCHPGHINLYALFIDFALRMTKPGGQIGLVVPSSFVAGPLYCRLRESIRTRSIVNVVGHVECREAFFLDVLQDVSLLSLKKHNEGHPVGLPVTFGRIDTAGKWTDASAIQLPAEVSNGWRLPSPSGSVFGGATLRDYGCKVTSGYFVWNREKQRMADQPKKRGTWVPLFWACNIRPLASCKPASRNGEGVDYVRFDEESPAILRGASVLLQRTTNSKQQRRLIAGLVNHGRFLSTGYVSENHTIVIQPEVPTANLPLVCMLLNSAAVDRRYRQVSGTASVSTLLLRELDLPLPGSMAKALEGASTFEDAVERAYVLSAESSWQIAS